MCDEQIGKYVVSSNNNIFNNNNNASLLVSRSHPDRTAQLTTSYIECNNLTKRATSAAEIRFPWQRFAYQSLKSFPYKHIAYVGQFAHMLAQNLISQ